MGINVAQRSSVATSRESGVIFYLILSDSFIGRCCDLFLLRAATVAPGPINKSPDNTPALKELPCGYARAILDA